MCSHRYVLPLPCAHNELAALPLSFFLKKSFYNGSRSRFTGHVRCIAGGVAPAHAASSHLHEMARWWCGACQALPWRLASHTHWLTCSFLLWELGTLGTQAFSEDGQWLAAGDSSGRISIWDLGQVADSHTQDGSDAALCKPVACFRGDYSPAS